MSRVIKRLVARDIKFSCFKSTIIFLVLKKNTLLSLKIFCWRGFDLVAAFAVLFLYNSSAKAQQKIFGYYASWNASLFPYNKIEYSKVTDINVAFGTPNSDGHLTCSLYYHVLELKTSNLGSSVYFYTLISGDFVQTKKMILLK